MIQDSLTHSDTISFAQAKHLLDTEPDCLLFDVREEEEFITGHPVEAELFTLDTIDAQTAELRIPSKGRCWCTAAAVPAVMRRHSVCGRWATGGYTTSAAWLAGLTAVCNGP